MGQIDETGSSSPAGHAEGPYLDSGTNQVYNLLFCDRPELFKAPIAPPYVYPFDLLFADYNSPGELEKMIKDSQTDPRVKVLACNKIRAAGGKLSQKELFAVIVEIGLEEGLDVLASFQNGTARYINHTGKILVWETTTDTGANELTSTLFLKSRLIVNQIGPWDKPRLKHPQPGDARISFLVSDGLYFGEAPIRVLYNDALAGPALAAATALMQYLTDKSLQQGL